MTTLNPSWLKYLTEEMEETDRKLRQAEGAEWFVNRPSLRIIKEFGRA